MSDSAKVGGAEQSALSTELAKSRRAGLGASIFSARIYEAVQGAGPEGLTVKEIHAKIKDVPGFLSDTLRWAQETEYGKLIGSNTILLGEERVRQRVHNLIKSQPGRPAVLISITGHRGRGESRYTAGRPPVEYRRKWIEQKPSGYIPIDTAVDDAAARRHVAIVQWLTVARKELAKTKSTRLRTLVEQAIELLAEKPSNTTD